MARLFVTSPLRIIDYPANSFHYATNRMGNEVIVIHATGGSDSKDYLSTTSSGKKIVSTHRLVDKFGHNYKIVQDKDVAFTQGPARIGRYPYFDQALGITITVNHIALSIELENLNNGRDPYPYEQLEMCAKQCVEWQGAYGIIPIVYHAFIQSNKTDPLGFPKETFQRLYLSELSRYI